MTAIPSQPLSPRREPLVKIRPDRGWSPLDLREVWRFRDLLLALALRDVKLRYRQTALGVGWVLIQPLLAAGIFALVFGRVAKLPSEGLPYFLFSYAGLLAWNAFHSTLSKASTSLVGNAQLVSKVYFPRLALPLSTVLSTVLDFVIGLALLAVLMAAYRVAPTPAVLLLPLWFVLVVLLATGLGLFASALTVSYRDVQYILPVIIPFLLYASPVGYSVSAVPHNLRPLFLLNPLTGLLEAFRWSVFGTAAPAWGGVLYSALAAAAVFVAGTYAFKNMERRFADVI